MEIVSREWEETFLRGLPNSILGCCSSLEKCHAVEIQGRPLIPFRSPNGKTYDNKCLICIREKVFQEYLEAITSDHGAEKIIQPWQNQLEDYHHGYFLLPNRISPTSETVFVGIVRPFARIPLSCYYDTPWGINQSIDTVEDTFYVNFEQKQRRDRFYDRRRFDELPDISFLILCSGIISPWRKSRNPHIQAINQLFFMGKESNPPWLWKRGNLREMLVFFIQDDKTLHEHINKIHPEWNDFLEAKIDVLKPMAICFWDRMYERLKNKNMHTMDHYDPEKVLDGMQKLWLAYDRNPMNPRAEVEHTRDVWTFLVNRRRRFGNRKIPLPKQLQHEKKLSLFVCRYCETIKALTDISNQASLDRKKKNFKHFIKKNLARQGTIDVMWDIYNNVYRCFRKRSGGRKALQNYSDKKKEQQFHCEEEVVEVQFEDSIVNVKNTAHVLCSKCNKITYLNSSWILKDGLCNRCSAVKLTAKTCIICGTVKGKTSKSPNWFHIDCIVDGGKKPVERKWFCGKHTKSMENIDKKITSAPLLYALIKDIPFN